MISRIHEGCEMRKRYRSHGLAFVVVLLAVGCGSRTGDVSGKVLYKGKPLSGGSVTFFHSKGASSSRIDNDGSYTVFKVPVGEAKITVQSLRAEGLSTPVRQQMIKAIKSGVVEGRKTSPQNERGPRIDGSSVFRIISAFAAAV